MTTVEVTSKNSRNLLCHHNIMNIITQICRPKLHLIYYFIIFASGVLFSCIMFFMLHRYPKQLAMHNLPTDNYLQVRDEFHVLSPYADQYEPLEYNSQRKSRERSSDGK